MAGRTDAVSSGWKQQKEAGGDYQPKCDYPSYFSLRYTPTQCMAETDAAGETSSTSIPASSCCCNSASAASPEAEARSAAAAACVDAGFPESCTTFVLEDPCQIYLDSDLYIEDPACPKVTIASRYDISKRKFLWGVPSQHMMT